MVVDEGVLSLMNYQTPDPLAFFHHAHEPGVSLFDLRSTCWRRSAEDALPARPRSRAEHFLKSPNGGRSKSADDADVWGGLTGTAANGVAGSDWSAPDAAAAARARRSASATPA
jgi:uncharacterized protein YfaS (alpha-2-macroglobulin family)